MDLINVKPVFPVKFKNSAGFTKADATSVIEKLFESAVADSKELREISL